MRAEFALVEAGFDKMPAFSGNGNKVIVVNSGASALEARDKITLATAQATTSGTAIDFTGIPSWVNRVTVTVYGVSWAVSSDSLLVQIGDSGGVETSGYSSLSASSNSSNLNSSAGFIINNSTSISNTVNSTVILTKHTGNKWNATGTSTAFDVVTSFAGVKELTGTLDRVRLTSVTGVTFDAGAVNISYE